MSIYLVPICIVVLEYAKIEWHKDSQLRHYLLLHLLMAGILGLSAPGLLAEEGSAVAGYEGASIAALLVIASYVTIDDKRKGGVLGSTLSGLSSYPVEGVALWFVYGYWSAAVALPTAYVVGIIWIASRPAHWTKSRWDFLYPEALKKRLRAA